MYKSTVHGPHTPSDDQDLALAKHWAHEKIVNLWSTVAQRRPGLAGHVPGQSLSRSCVRKHQCCQLLLLLVHLLINFEGKPRCLMATHCKAYTLANTMQASAAKNRHQLKIGISYKWPSAIYKLPESENHTFAYSEFPESPLLCHIFVHVQQMAEVKTSQTVEKPQYDFYYCSAYTFLLRVN